LEKHSNGFWLITQVKWKGYEQELKLSQTHHLSDAHGDGEMQVTGHLRSLKLVPFESLSAVSYSLSVVTMLV